jgi:hypothetical protein
MEGKVAFALLGDISPLHETLYVIDSYASCTSFLRKNRLFLKLLAKLSLGVVMGYLSVEANLEKLFCCFTFFL